MFDPIFSADPSFRPRWVAFTAEWSDEAEPPLYLALAELARHVVECLNAQRTENLDAIFAVVEPWHADGDAYVREAATIGMLESLQNLLGGDDRGGSAVEAWLGPESKRWWDKLDRFWAGNSDALSC
ncbi:DUF7674 family protein [Chenggangzhangella methanolivorans]|uniref:DUF7674 domain-containing protein n=1 Tax=Chenggangzhangella methanolivorans TaxID=1437009 RepID=A0A9E6R765_9HYPH|nr:hypothetical protein [Chenggangzhangella methanolivorans]QZN99233.1 hypothetical protein K6K41_20840 [Chenggangzhangella methanolivorans]